MDRSILNGVRNVCLGQRCICFVSVLSEVFPIVLLQPLRGQETSRSSAVFLVFAAVSRTAFCCPSTVYSTCYSLFFAAKLRKDRIQRKEYIVVIIEAPEKWKPQILLGISGRSFALFLHMNFQQTVETHVENLLMPVEFLWNRQKSTAKSCFPHVLQCPFPVLYAWLLLRIFLMVSSTSCFRWSSCFIAVSMLLME